MKRLGVSMLAGMIVLGMGQASARETTGTVLLPSVQVPAGVPGVAPGLATRPARCAHLLGAPNGILMHHEAIAADEDNRPFTLTGTADFDIVFFADLGTCDNAPASTTLNDLDFLGPGDEEGMIPNGARHALIGFEAAPPNQTFTFTIGG